LEEALRCLAAADGQNPNDWAIQCDLGSSRMRLAYWRGDESEFPRARKHLELVIDQLRPEYGFALYEIGRVCRLQGRFEEAAAFFDRARAIPYDYRDVSDRRLEFEKTRAAGRNRDYP